MRTKSIFIIFLTAWFLATFTFGNPPLFSDSLKSTDYVKEIQPLKEHQRVVIEIIRDLKRNHYRKIPIDNALSSKVLDRYLSDLDPAHLYFIASDIKEFEDYRYRLNDGLLRGDVTSAYKIFNRYQERLSQRMVFIISHIDHGLKYTNHEMNENLDIDREKAPWPLSRAELEDLWLKTLKNDVINMRLEGKSNGEIVKTLQKRYINQLKRLRQTTSEDVFQLYMDALATSYDPHTQYFSPRSSENFNINMSLSLEGIGAMLTSDNEYTKVVRLIPAGPADRSRLIKPNDRVIGVGQGPDGEVVDVVGWRLDDVVDLIRGPRNTVVRLKIIPADTSDEHQTRIVKLTRGTVQLEDQAASKDVIDLVRGAKAYRIGIIHIPTFYLDIKAMNAASDDYKSTTRDVKRILNELNALHVAGVIIDLRDNGGGSLQEANTLTGLFIKSGPTVQIRSSEGLVQTLYDTDPKIYYSGPMAVIVSRLSASASEIFAGAIKDYGRGIIVGDSSFGKGTVQTLLTLSRGQLKITTAKFYRISGESTQHRGIMPDLYYPSLYNKETIGESSLKDAMPWDSISPVPHYTYPDLSLYKARLRSLHAERIRHDPDYQYLLNMITYLKQARDKKKISLNLSTRLKEKKRSEEQRLSLENRLRKAKGQKPLTNLDQINEEEKDKAQLTRTKPAREDPELVESAQILVDYLQLQGKTNSVQNARAAAD